MKLFFLFLFFVITSFSASAQFKPEAMILPITFVNFNDTALQESLDNFVQTELSRNFELKSKDEVDEAMEKAIDEMDSENCTQEACIKKMGRMLDVDYTFNLKIIDTGQVWDLIAIRIHYFENRTMRRTELCNNCSLTKARKLISAMLSTMGTGEVSLKGGKSRLLVESTPRSAVFIDGYPKGETPLDLSVDANKSIEIHMVAEGYNDFTEELILKPGEKVSINKKLVRKRGNIRITSEPSGATIYIDGKLELDAQEKTLKTPADLYMLFGEHELELKYERYEDSTQTLKINKRKLGTKNIILKPKPGRLIIRVPSEFKSAEVYVDGKSIGDMDGLIAKTFELSPNVSHTIQAEDGNYKSETKSISIEPDGSKRVEFENFAETKKNTFKLPEWLKFEFPSWDDFKLPDWNEKKRSMYFSYSSYLVKLKNMIDLNYTILGIGLQWKHLKIESTLANPDSYFKNSSNESIDSFYFSDGSNIHEVTSTEAKFTRIMYAPSLPEGFYPKNSWIWGTGLEFSEITLTTKNDGDRKITARFPVIEGGYQWNWPNFYFNLQIQLKFGPPNISAYSYGSALGGVW